jgi:hypothetical protein
MDFKPINDALAQIQNAPLLHEQIINDLGKKYGIDHLEILEGWLMTDAQLSEAKHILKYIENVITNLREEGDLRKKVEVLQHDELIHKTTIRTQESRIRNLQEEALWFNVAKRYWYVVLGFALAFGFLGEYLSIGKKLLQLFDIVPREE